VSGELHLVWEADEAEGKGGRWVERLGRVSEQSRALTSAAATKAAAMGQRVGQSAESFADAVDGAALAAQRKLEEVGNRKPGHGWSRLFTLLQKSKNQKLPPARHDCGLCRFVMCIRRR